jgi:molybdenum cofactor biosynthesis enzyme
LLSIDSHAHISLLSNRLSRPLFALLSGTMAVKRTSELIPFCHPLPIEGINFTHSFAPSPSSALSPSVEAGSGQLTIECRVRVFHKTGSPLSLFFCLQSVVSDAR